MESPLLQMIDPVSVLEAAQGAQRQEPVPSPEAEGTPAMLSGKLQPAKFTVFSANASRMPLEIAFLLPFWLEGQWFT